jgi:hypothetical protein
MLGSLVAKELMAGGIGGLGENVEQARNTGFFRWFHLEETGRTAGQAGPVVEFKPSGEKFRAAVTLKLSLDSREKLVGAELALTRSFIDSGRDGMFARDIAKSFLGIVTAVEDRNAIGSLITEIEQPPANLSSPLIVREQPAPKLPVAPSPGYWTFLGQQEFYEQRLASGRIRFENRDVNGVPSLLIVRIPR